uniref:Sec1 family domain containing 1 n=1 Tax=Scophthalmus maximus TaxID=52904 RepID=A0A8D2ZHR0_SCOMX
MRWTRPPCESPCFYVVLNTVVELNGSEYVAFMLNFQTLTETGDGISGAHSPAAKKGQRSLPWTFEGIISFSDFSRQDFHLNMVMMEEGAGAEPSPAGARPKKKSRKTYDLTAADRFWQKHKGSPFPEVAESVQEELDTYRAQEDEVKRLKSIMGLEGEDEGAISMSDNRAKLTSAVSSLPELLEKKRLIDLHTNVATAVLDHIKSRKLDVYFEYEEKLMSKATLDKSLLDIISDPDAGTPEDKMRLFLIYYISAQQAPSESDLEQYKTALLDTGCDLSPLNYIKQWKLFSRVMNSGSQFVMEGVKNLVPKQDNLPVTRILDNMMEMKSHPETDDYRYFDPKMLRGSESSIPRNKNPFQEAIVFVVGGGNYIEYQNLVDYSKSKQGKKVVYGCSELFNATQFIKQLAQLGQK